MVAIESPVRLCCGQRHWSVACPDGLVMCCVCYKRVAVEQLAIDPEDGKRWDVCLSCEPSTTSPEPSREGTPQ